jgi:hypothetical protein
VVAPRVAGEFGGEVPQQVAGALPVAVDRQQAQPLQIEQQVHARLRPDRHQRRQRCELALDRRQLLVGVQRPQHRRGDPRAGRVGAVGGQQQVDGVAVEPRADDVGHLGGRAPVEAGRERTQRVVEPVH